MYGELTFAFKTPTQPKTRRANERKRECGNRRDFDGIRISNDFVFLRQPLHPVGNRPWCMFMVLCCLPSGTRILRVADLDPNRRFRDPGHRTIGAGWREIFHTYSRTVESHAGQGRAKSNIGSISHMRSRFERYCPQDQPRRMLLPASAQDAVTFGLREIQGVQAPIRRPALRS